MSWYFTWLAIHLALSMHKFGNEKSLALKRDISPVCTWPALKTEKEIIWVSQNPLNQKFFINKLLAKTFFFLLSSFYASLPMSFSSTVVLIWVVSKNGLLSFSVKYHRVNERFFNVPGTLGWQKLYLMYTKNAGWATSNIALTVYLLHRIGPC